MPARLHVLWHFQFPRINLVGNLVNRGNWYLY
jgi:hypothetical protein